MNSLSTSTLLTPSSSSLLPFNNSSSSSSSSSKPRTAFFKSHPFSIRATNLSSSLSSTHSKSLADTLGFGYDTQPSSYSASLTSAATPEYAQRAAAAVSDPMGLLLTERIVFLGNEIDDFVADTIIFQLLLLDAKDPTKDIRLFINSPGGSLSATLAIYDVMQLVRADVSTIGMGITASTAAIILGAGTKGKRLALPNTRIMFHQPVGGIGGDVRNAQIQAKELAENKKTVVRIISEFSDRSLEQVEIFIERDRYLSPSEAVEFGALDGVIDRDSIIPVQELPEERIGEPDNNNNKKKTIYKPNDVYDFGESYEEYINPDIPDDEIY